MTAPSKMAEELWEKYRSQLFSKVDEMVSDTYMTKSDFLAALREYGAAVRTRDAEICKALGDALEIGKSSAYGCAAAIAREPMP